MLTCGRCLQALDHLKVDHPIIEEIICKLMSLKASGFDIHLCWHSPLLAGGGSRGSVSGRALDFGLIGVSTCGFESHQGPFRSLTFPPVLRDWVIEGFGMSSLVYATGHIKDPVPLIEKGRGLSPGGRFPPSFIHQVIIITGLNKLQLYVLALKMALDADRA